MTPPCLSELQPTNRLVDFARRRCLFRRPLLMVMLSLGESASGKACPPGVFDFGPSCPDYARQVVVCHHGAGGPLLPDPTECARAATDLALINLTSTIPCDYEPNVIVIGMLSPTDPELLCTNAYYQAEFNVLEFGNLAIVEFPRPINAYEMAAIYDALPAVLSASPNGLGSVDGCYSNLNYTPLPDGTWHWVYDYPVPWHTSCRQEVFRAYVTESGQVMPPGDLTCDGVVNLSDVTPFVESLMGAATFSGCNAYPADVDGNGVRDGADVQSFIGVLTS